MKSLVFTVLVAFAFQAAAPSTTTVRTTAPTTFTSTTTTTPPTTTTTPPTTTTTPPTTTTTPATTKTTPPTTTTTPPTTTTTPPTTTTTPPTTTTTTPPTTTTTPGTISAVNTTVKVELKIDNREFDKNLENYLSDKYKEFEKQFKELMDDAYSDLDGYKGVEIVGLRPGSIIVDHNVIVEVKYKENVDITEDYKKIVQLVKETVNEVKESSQNCTDGSGSCFSFDLDFGSITEVEIPNADFCEQIIPRDLIEFFTQMVTSEGLTCISHCDKLSPKYLDCNSGRCVIQNGTGLQCLCPRTDIYMYTGPKCTGKIKKLELYGGIGAAIAGLTIIIAIVGIFLCKRKKKTNQNKYMYDDNDESNDYHEITNPGFYKEGPTVNKQSNTDKFKPKRGNIN